MVWVFSAGVSMRWEGGGRGRLLHVVLTRWFCVERVTGCECHALGFALLLIVGGILGVFSGYSGGILGVFFG